MALRPPRDPDEAGGRPDQTDDAVVDARVQLVIEVANPAEESSRWVSAVLLAAVLAGGVFGLIKYHQVSGQLAELRRDQADRGAVAQLAKDYALKSLTYSFEDPDAFFRSVEDGVSQQLKDKYVNATDLLEGVMLQAQVTSTGEVLAVDPIAQPGGAYQVVVSAHQTTRNLQNPTPKVSIILLQVTVNKAGQCLAGFRYRPQDRLPPAGRGADPATGGRAPPLSRPAPPTGAETVGARQ